MKPKKENAVHIAVVGMEKGALDRKEIALLLDALTNIDTLAERDAHLEELWADFGNAPMDPDTEKLEADFHIFPEGTDREDVWHWFDERHSKGVAYLLYGGAENYVSEAKQLYGLSKLCFECESKTCQYNHGGECRFALVHERKPRITDDDGCIDYDYQEGEV